MIHMKNNEYEIRVLFLIRDDMEHPFLLSYSITSFNIPADF